MKLSRYLEPNRWPKSGPLALNGVLLVAQKWPVGKQGFNIWLCSIEQHIKISKSNGFLKKNDLSCTSK